MSRRLFFVAVVVTLVLASFAAPAVAAPLSAQALVLAQTEAGPRLGATPPVLLPPIQQNGGCESGGAGGCPI
jgi:hypothetical protein